MARLARYIAIGRHSAAGPAGANISFFLISHPIPVNSAQKFRRHDTAGCGSGKFFIFAPYCLAAHFLHWNYFTQGSHIVYILRHSRPFPNPAAAFSGLIDRQLGYFLSSTRRTYPIRPPEQVRKSTFFQYCTPGIIRNRLIKFFCQNRTLHFDVSGAIQAHLNESAHFLYSIQPRSRPNLPDQAGEQPRSCPIRPAMPLYYSKGKPYHPVNPLPPQVIPCT